jgi:hypothetical protein
MQVDPPAVIDAVDTKKVPGVVPLVPTEQMRYSRYAQNNHYSGLKEE